VGTNLITTLEYRAAPADLMARARVWEWEKTVRELLPEVISNGEIICLFQPIYELRAGVPLSRGYEALARFPNAPRIPVGLWFRVAHDIGRGVELELATANKALESLIRFHHSAYLFLNASVATAAVLAGSLSPGVASRVVIDIPYSADLKAGSRQVFEALTAIGAKVSIDDVPIYDLEYVSQHLHGLRPHYVKVDVNAGLSDNTTRMAQLARGSAWCHEAGINLVAERVETARDLLTLAEVGIEWAQGYSLARPTEL
jgi:EAL domain-containing protein (putative c-di-GMP-specific phosphodiesterase class I)